MKRKNTLNEKINKGRELVNQNETKDLMVSETKELIELSGIKHEKDKAVDLVYNAYLYGLYKGALESVYT